jgi:hypothetical protein
MKTIKIILILSLWITLFSACKKDSNNNGKSSTSTAEYYFKGSLNGTATDWEATITGTGWTAGSSAALVNDQGDISGGITAELTYFPAQQQVFGIEFKTFDKGPDADAATVFNGFVQAGAWAYASTTDYIKATKSIVIYYTDSNGNQYSTIGSQTGSTANVVSAIQVTGDAYNSDAGLKIKMTFTCTLYPVSGAGGSIKITNGEATMFLDDLLNS